MLYALCLFCCAVAVLFTLFKVFLGLRNPQLSHARRTRTLTYIYSATATVEAPGPTYLVFPAPVTRPPTSDVVPTVLRDFTEELLGRNAQPANPELPTSVDVKEGIARPRVGDGVGISKRRPGITFNIEPIVSAPPLAGPARGGYLLHEEDAPLSGPSGVARSPSPTSRDSTENSRSRSSSLSQLSSDEASPTLARSRGVPLPKGKAVIRPLSSLDANGYLAREERTAAASEGADGVPFKVYWWETRSAERIACPPSLTNRKELAEGDIFLHRWGEWLTNGGEHVQLWIWITEDGRSLHWKAVQVGYTRLDGRVLCLTEKRKLPSWLERSWFMKRRAQNRV